MSRFEYLYGHVCVCVYVCVCVRACVYIKIYKSAFENCNIIKVITNVGRKTPIFLVGAAWKSAFRTPRLSSRSSGVAGEGNVTVGASDEGSCEI